MPVTYTLDPKTRLISMSCVGSVTLAEVLEHLREFQKDPGSAGPVDVFLDLTETTSLPVGFQIATVADQLKKVRETVRFNACAVIAQRDALFGMMRMFQVMAEPYFRAIRVFRSYAEGEAWLTLERLQLGIASEVTPGSSGKLESEATKP